MIDFDTSLRVQVHVGTYRVNLEEDPVPAYLVLFRPEGTTERNLAINYAGGLSLAPLMSELRKRWRSENERRNELAPGFWGSSRCQSGSIASGGWHSFCTCDTCF